MSGKAAGRTGRGSLTRDRVVRAAVALADEVTLEGLTMRALGDRLGVKAMSLYNHVADKEDLLDGMIDVVYDEIDLPDGGDWRAVMRERAHSTQDVLARHPWAIGLMDSRTSPGPANLRHHDRVLGVLRHAGFSVEEATFAYSVLDGYIYGFALQHANVTFTSAQELAEVSEAIVTAMPIDHYPHLREAAIELSTTGFEYLGQFERGLDLILDGLAGRHGPG